MLCNYTSRKMYATSKSICIHSIDFKTKSCNYIIYRGFFISSRRNPNDSMYRTSEIIFFFLLYLNSDMCMITTVDITAMTQILRDQKVTITHMGFLRKMIHRPVMIRKDLLGDGCYLQHQHVCTLITICLQTQNHLNS